MLAVYRPRALVRLRRDPGAAGRAPLLQRAGAAGRAGHRAADRGWVGHTGRGGFLIVGLANGLRSLPELGLLTLLVLAMGIGLLPVTIALAVLGHPAAAGRHLRRGAQRRPVGRRRGPRGGHARVAGAAQGGAAERAAADPGRRCARPSLQVIATAAVAAYVGFGGLGRLPHRRPAHPRLPADGRRRRAGGPARPASSRRCWLACSARSSRRVCAPAAARAVLRPPRSPGSNPTRAACPPPPPNSLEPP